MRFKKVAVGGTFDYLHDGHIAILSKAFEIGERVLVGIVSDKMKLKKDSAGIQPLGTRRKKLLNLLRDRGWLNRAEVCAISDPHGPAVEDRELEAIVVSGETRPRAKEINEVRKKNGLNHLKIIQIPWVLARDGTPVSSIRVRYGEMDTHGKIKKAKGDISDAG